ncbi:hypothetical protein D1867_05745 [Acidianus infernus]|uniref:GINS subunit domain-containing protein n=1 Tax=Acidianus infernus TaxID=12915 RepID=A0A6A9QF15_ACIIN|nr:hypothetical protein [Acidianus infernus]MUM64754.1 hypothetical protein [Acidianus infernus]
MFKVLLRALDKLQLTEKKKVAVFDDIGPLDLGFIEISLSKGSEDEIPLWLAQYLEKQNLVKINSITTEELGKLLFQEKQNSTTPASLVKTYPDIYFRIKKLEEELKAKGLNGLEELKKVKSMVNEISLIRLRKIIQLASLSINDQTLISKMTKEEYLAYLSMRKIITSFYGDVIGNPTN